MPFDIFDPDPRGELSAALEAGDTDTAKRLVTTISKEAHAFSRAAERDPDINGDQLHRIWSRVIYISELAGDSFQADYYRMKLMLKKIREEEDSV